MSLGLLFADDFKLFKPINNIDDTRALQTDLNLALDWFKENKMLVNTKKCCVVSFSRRINTVIEDYYIGNCKVVRCREVKDLGVIFQDNFKFNNHYNYLINKAYRILGFVMRNSKDFDIQSTTRLYTSLVRPHLEYASNIWSPNCYTHSNEIEKVQKRFLRYIYIKRNNMYPTMLEQINVGSINVGNISFNFDGL